MKNVIRVLLMFITTFIIPKNSISQTWAWAKNFSSSSSGNMISWSVASDFAGNVYTTGWFYGNCDFDPGTGNFNLTAMGNGGVFISKLDASGNFIWAKAVTGTVESYSIAVDPASNVIYITGAFGDSVDFNPDTTQYFLKTVDNYDVYILKLDSNGNFIWARSFGGRNYEGTVSIETDFSGSESVYLTGWFNDTCDFDPDTSIYNLVSQGGSDIFISKLNSSGNLLWAHSFGGVDDDAGISLKSDPSNANFIYAAGNFSGQIDFDPGSGVSDLYSSTSVAFILKLDALGNFSWVKKLEGLIKSISVSGDDIYSTGFFSGPADFDPDTSTYILNGDGIYISKLNSEGSFVWAKGIDLYWTCFECNFSIAANPAVDGVYIGGHFESTVDFDPGSGIYNLTSVGFEDNFILKLDSAGVFSWVKQIRGTDSDISNSLNINSSGYLYVTGWYWSSSLYFDTHALSNSNNSSDIFIAKMDLLNTTSVTQFENKEKNFSVYPNPSSREIFIHSDENDGRKEILIFNMEGRKIADYNMLSNEIIKIDVRNYAEGLYIVVIKNDKENLTAKFQVVHQ